MKMKNWKTTLSGVGVLLGGIGLLIKALTGEGDVSLNEAITGIMAGLAGLGLIGGSDGGV